MIEIIVIKKELAILSIAAIYYSIDTRSNRD